MGSAVPVDGGRPGVSMTTPGPLIPSIQRIHVRDGLRKARSTASPSPFGHKTGDHLAAAWLLRRRSRHHPVRAYTAGSTEIRPLEPTCDYTGGVLTGRIPQSQTEALGLTLAISAPATRLDMENLLHLQQPPPWRMKVCPERCLSPPFLRPPGFPGCTTSITHVVPL